MNKKVLMLSVLSSFLVLGSAVGVAIYQDAYNMFDAEANNDLTMTWVKGEEYMKGQDENNHIRVSYVDGVFQNIDPIQRISALNLFGSIGNGGVEYQVGYYTNGFGSEVAYTNTMVLDDITQGIYFAKGEEPSFVKIWNWELSGSSQDLTITYQCVNGAKEEVNNYPKLKAGYYITGEKHFFSWRNLDPL